MLWFRVHSEEQLCMPADKKRAAVASRSRVPCGHPPHFFLQVCGHPRGTATSGCTSRSWVPRGEGQLAFVPHCKAHDVLEAQFTSCCGARRPLAAVLLQGPSPGTSASQLQRELCPCGGACDQALVCFLFAGLWCSLVCLWLPQGMLLAFSHFILFFDSKLSTAEMVLLLSPFFFLSHSVHPSKTSLWSQKLRQDLI